MMRTLFPLALLAACSGDDGGNNDDTNSPPGDDDDTVGDTATVGDDDDDDTTEPLPGVMRNCPTDVGNICPYAGAGYNGSNGDGQDRLDVWFSLPMSIAFPPAGVGGRPIIADWNNHKLRAVNDTIEEGVETIMGTDFLGDGDPLLADRTAPGVPGDTISLNHPTQQMYFSDGRLLSASWHTHKFREWDPTTGLAFVALGGRSGMSTDPVTGLPYDFNQPQAGMQMNQPKELFIDPNNEDHIYILDMRNERIRLWDRAAAVINTIAGELTDSAVDPDTTTASKGYCGEGPALATCFNFPKNANPEPGGAFALNADSTVMYVADSENHIIRAIDLVTGTTSLLSGTAPTYDDAQGDNDGTLENTDIVTEPGHRDGAADQALWNYPVDFAYDADTNDLFVADANNHVIRMIDLDTMMVSTVAGTPETPTCPSTVCPEQQTAGDGGPATAATLYRPFGVDLDNDGNLVVSDTYNHRLRIVYR